MSKITEAKMATLNDKIYNDAKEQESKRARKPRKKLKLSGRGSGRTSRTKKAKKK